MRVAHFAKYTFVRMGGMERHVATLSKALAAHGIDVTVFSYDPSGSLEPSTVDGVRVEPIPALLNFSSQAIAPKLISRARHLARPHPFNILHQHWPDPFAHAAASLMPGRPAHVVSWHSDIVRQTFLGPIYQMIAPRLLVRPDALIGATHAHLQSPQVALFAPPARRHVIPYSIDALPFTPTAEILQDAATLRNSHGGGSLVFALGRHVYYKGYDILIRAMPQVPARLILGGQGPLTPALRQLAAELRAPVDFVGVIPERQLPVYYHACDVFCLPSLAKSEAFGLVQAEAMASQKPIVNTSLDNGVNELAPDKQCALTVQPADISALRDALCTILRDPALASRLGKAGRERLNRHYTVESMLRNTIRVYEHVIRTQRSG